MRGIKHEKGVVEWPIQHKPKPSVVLRAQDHGLRVLYSAGTARAKRALTNLLYFGRAQVERRLAYRFDFPLSGSDRLTRWKKHHISEHSEYYTLYRAYCPYLARTANETALL